MMASVFSITLETALNRYLRLDPEGLREFGNLQDKVIAIDLKGINQTFYLLPGSEHIRVLDKYDGEVHTHLSGTPLALAKLGISDTVRSGLFADDVEIRGDIDTGKRFKEILDSLDADWEEPLARIAGDVFAHQVGNTIRRTGKWASQSFDIFLRDLSEYLTEEGRVLPTRIELENLYGDVDESRMAVDRLEARVKQLYRKLQPRETGSNS